MSALITQSTGLWKLAQNQINKLKPSQTFTAVNQQKIQSKSIQSIFKNIPKKNMQSLVPKGTYHIVQTKKQVPQSVKFLDYYSQKMGFLPMGPIYQNGGNKYIGRTQQMTSKGQRYYKAFQQASNNNGIIQTPNLSQNLSFIATRAIQKWNQFVQMENQLANFLESVSTQQGRKQLILQYAQSSSKGTDTLRVLSTLYYLYFDQKSPNKNLFKLTGDAFEQFKRILRRQNRQLSQMQNDVMDFLQRRRIDSNIFGKGHQYKIKSIQMSLTPEQYQMIRPYLFDEKAYVPKQMIKQSFLANSQWFQIFSKGQKKHTIVVQNWPIDQPWFKPVNYMRS